MPGVPEKQCIFFPERSCWQEHHIVCGLYPPIEKNITQFVIYIHLVLTTNRYLKTNDSFVTIRTRDVGGEHGDGDRDDDDGGDCDHWENSCDGHHLEKYTCAVVSYMSVTYRGSKPTHKETNHPEKYTYNIDLDLQYVHLHLSYSRSRKLLHQVTITGDGQLELQWWDAWPRCLPLTQKKKWLN